MIWLCIAAITVVLSGCTGENWYSQTALFPPQSDYDVNRPEWKYLAEVRVSTKEPGLLTEKQNKHIRVSIVDRKRSLLLLDEFQVHSGYIEITIEWSTFDLLEIKLRGSESTDFHKPRAADDYALPMILSYMWEPKIRQFSKITSGEMH